MTFMQWRIRMAKMMDFYLGRLLAALGPLLKIVSKRRCKGRSTQKILFIKFWGMGSIILSEPALRRLREIHPHAEIHYLTLEQNRELFELIPSVDRVYSVPFRSLFGLLWASLCLVPRLRKERYGLIFDAEFFVSFSGFLSRLISANRVIGFSQQEGVKKYLLDVCVPFSDRDHTVSQFLKLVEATSVMEQSLIRLRLSFSKVSQLQNSEWHPHSECHRPGPYMVININASPLALERRWPRERFLELSKALLRAYDFDLVLIGSPAEKPYVSPLEHELGCPQRVLNGTGKLSLLQLAALIRGALLLISNDSGPVHMGSAFDTPTVAFYGPETPLRYGSLRSQRLIFYRQLWCSPCMSLDNAKTVHCINHLSCMKGFDTNEVTDRIFHFINQEILDCHPSQAAAGII